ncbi:alpha/beta fold hydrolase [Nocardia bhagyanarayanae]|uniref:Pimeloyl-ACP methyl ester carboxylesterase n=1 Tax=Nocardia bhagyanarayanae TaxID=1215925 RepID=A0A543F7V3_9NOCA|nr:alpha/beta hydrolase [Nocardia bhagyanarayanae]TQM29891.1 pimeloyl-ACP methyl ester carboxylesterase [Nocardia bhagyanarayanae]
MTTWNHHRVGTGEPLVLVHGVGSRWQIWEPIIDTLAASFDVIAVDLPGFGRSDPLPHTTVDELTDALADWLAAQGIERPHLGGNSMGGLIALKLGARGLARSVTAYSPAGFWDTAGRVWCQQSLGKSVVLARTLRPLLPTILGTAAGRTVFLSLIFGKPWAVDAQVAIGTAEGAIESTGFAEALDSFKDVRLPEIGALADIPVTIAWGNRDILLTYATQHRRARAELPNARHVTLRGSGHSPYFDDPEGCARLLLDQLDRNRT